MKKRTVAIILTFAACCVFTACTGQGAKDGGAAPEAAQDGQAQTEQAAETKDGGTDEKAQEAQSQDAQAGAAQSEAAKEESPAGSFSQAEGRTESIFARIDDISDGDVTEVKYSGEMEGSLEGDDLEYLVRDAKDGGVRIDIPALRAGNYTLTVVAKGTTYEQGDLAVKAYDRSGYAHFGYDRGLGAYKNDGTLKDGAIVLYVTDENKNEVEVSCGDVTVKGIGNILNSGGMAADKPADAGKDATAEGKDADESKADDVPRTSKGGLANTNQGIIKLLADAGTPLDVRFIGIVSDTGLYETAEYDPKPLGKIEGLTAFSLDKEIVEANGGEIVYDYGANAGDNGHMARMVSGRDITLEGIGDDAVIDGWGFHFIASSSDKDTDRGESFEVRKLTFINTAEDALGMEGNTEKNEEGKDDINLPFTRSVDRIWIHNNEFYRPSLTQCAAAEGDKMEGDGSIDIKKGQYATFSYNYFEGCHKTSLVGGNDSALTFNITYHHNHWKDCETRAPLSRNANIHMYNNIFDSQSGYCENVRANGFIFSEYNIFNSCRNPYWVKDPQSAIKSYKDFLNDVYYEDQEEAGEVTVVEDKTENVPNECAYIAGDIKYDKFETDPALSYIPDEKYELQTDEEAIEKAIREKTGSKV